MKRIQAKQVKAMETHLNDSKGLEKFPQLKGFLSDTHSEGEGGRQERESGTVYFAARGGVLLVTLKEPSQALMLRMEVPSVAMLLPCIEAALGDEGSMWEVDPWARQRRKTKKK